MKSLSIDIINVYNNAQCFPSQVAFTSIDTSAFTVDLSMIYFFCFGIFQFEPVVRFDT